MNNEELWEKMQTEFTFIKSKIREIDDIKLKLNEIDHMKARVSKIDTIESKLNEIDDIKVKVSKIDNIETKVNEIDNIKEELNKINNKLDVVTNVNMAQILREHTKTRQDINNKIDEFILQNNVEHKQFAYQIARLEKKNGIMH